MSTFLFLKVSGKNYLTDKHGAEKIKELIQVKLGRSITLLKVESKGDEILLYGNCDSWVAREKAIILAGNVKGVVKVRDDYLYFPASEFKSEFHTIKQNETLSDIASLYYGEPQKFLIIYEANKEIMSTPTDIYPGLTIRVPILSLVKHMRIAMAK